MRCLHLMNVEEYQKDVVRLDLTDEAYRFFTTFVSFELVALGQTPMTRSIPQSAAPPLTSAPPPSKRAKIAK